MTTETDLLQEAVALLRKLGKPESFVQLTRDLGSIEPLLAKIDAMPAGETNDTARLDFVIRDEALVALWAKLDGTTAYRLEWESGERQSEWYSSPRDAIDARMLAASQRHGGVT